MRMACIKALVLGFVPSLAVSGSPEVSRSQEDAAELLPSLSADDECRANGSDEACGLKALQRAAARRAASAATVKYQDAGPGTCQVRGEFPQHVQYTGILWTEAACESACTANAACTGYSYNLVSWSCVLFTEGPLSGGGAEWNDAHCVIKVDGSSQPTATPPSDSQNYQDSGPGTCTVQGHSPNQEYHQGLSKAGCQDMCTTKACFGYSWKSDGECKLFTQGPLSGGGPRWGDAHCVIKVGGGSSQPPATPPSSPQNYQDSGPGTCTVQGHSPDQEYHAGLSKAACQDMCTARACFGYSWKLDGECKLFTQGPLSGGGPRWGDAHCIIKTT